MTHSPSPIAKPTVAALRPAPLPDSPGRRSSYRWLIKALVTQALVIQLGCCFIAVAPVLWARSSCNGCHMSASEPVAALSGSGILLGYAIALGQTVLSVSVYFLFRLIDRPPYRLRPLAIVLLAAYLLWPLLATLSWLDTP